MKRYSQRWAKSCSASLLPSALGAASSLTPNGGLAGPTFYANEDQTCSFSGRKSVAYGANGEFNCVNLTGGTASNALASSVTNL